MPSKVAGIRQRAAGWFARVPSWLGLPQIGQPRSLRRSGGRNGALVDGVLNQGVHGGGGEISPVHVKLGVDPTVVSPAAISV